MKWFIEQIRCHTGKELFVTQGQKFIIRNWKCVKDGKKCSIVDLKLEGSSTPGQDTENVMVPWNESQ